MKKTKTRIVLEKHNFTILRPVCEKSAVPHATPQEMLLLPKAGRHFAQRFSMKATIPIGLLILVSGCAILDFIVLQIFPVPADLWRDGTMREITASRPTAAMTINVVGQLIMVGVVACGVTRLTKSATRRAGMVMTSVVITLVSLNVLLTRNFHWPIVLGFVLLPVVGYVGTRFGARSHA